jgi:hypothetical protein
MAGPKLGNHWGVTPSFPIAEIPRLPPSDFEPLPAGDGSLRVRDRKLWQVVRVAPFETPGRDLAVPQFLDILAGNPQSDPVPVTEFEKAFAKTPLVAATWGLDAKLAIAEALTRGHPGDPRSRDVVRDGRDRAAAAAASFLRDEVAIAGEQVLVRRRPLAFWRTTGGRVTLDVMPSPNSGSRTAYPFDIGRRAEVLKGYHESGEVDVPPATAAILDALPGDPDPGTEAMYYANLLPGAAIATIQGARAKGVRTFPEGTLELGERLEPYADTATIGALTVDEAETALRLCRDIAWRLRQLPSSSRTMQWSTLNNYFERDRIGGPPRNVEDEAWLGSFSV